jgi:hemerythrin-like domain-containing protein
MMLLEHHQMRELVAALDALVRQDAPWSPSDLQRLTDAALSYTGQLREHIMKENEMLYPMAMEHLPPPAQEQVDVECAALDEARASDGSDDALRRLASDLVAKYAA